MKILSMLEQEGARILTEDINAFVEEKKRENEDKPEVMEVLEEITQHLRTTKVAVNEGWC